LMGESFDAVVVGSGPNGLAAAITLARAGLNVTVLEAKETPGGGCRTAELTLPGFRHDICSAIHPMGVSSPFFQELGLERNGLKWARSPVPLAHALDDGRAAVLHSSLEETAEGLGVDGESWTRMMEPFVEHSAKLFPEILRPMRGARHPFLMARFGLLALRSCESIVNARFKTDEAKALLAGNAAH